MWELYSRWDDAVAYKGILEEYLNVIKWLAVIVFGSCQLFLCGKGTWLGSYLTDCWRKISEKLVEMANLSVENVWGFGEKSVKLVNLSVNSDA